MEITQDVLGAIGGAVLSLGFAYIPGLSTWFAGKDSKVKSLIMLGLLALIGAACYGLACWGVLAELTGLNLTCDQAGLFGLIRAFVAAAIVSQTTYQLAPETGAVREAKQAR